MLNRKRRDLLELVTAFCENHDTGSPPSCWSIASYRSFLSPILYHHDSGAKKGARPVADNREHLLRVRDILLTTADGK